MTRHYVPLARIFGIDVGLNFVEAYRAERVVEDLRARVAPTAAVLRAGAWATCPAALVP